MTFEEMERTMAFILEHRADSTVRMQCREEAQAKNDEQIAKNSEHLAQLDAHLTRLADQQAIGFQELREIQAQTAKDIRTMVKAQARTSAEVEVVGTHLREFIAEVRTWKK